MEIKNPLEVIIIGGSYAGLSAAMTLGRAMRKVLVIDSGKPCNAQTPHSHNFITHDGETPAEITGKAKAEVLKYPTVEFLNDRVISAQKSGLCFELKTESGKKLSAKKLVFATGLKDRMPEIAGFAACWGISVIHCPYCHGYEVRHQKTAILANGNDALHFAQVLSNWTKELVLFTNGLISLDPDQQAQLTKHGISWIETPVSQLIHSDGQIKHLVLSDGQEHAFNVMYARIPFDQHSSLPQELGCTLTEHGFLQVDELQHTSISGIYAAGDNATMLRAVSQAVAAGMRAGAAINYDLIMESW
ncbi:Thioredoxin reductase [Pedobacter steynii]|uniref:Thioredoxin reductase n=1 Tax=Pedobacter steynii TaxID=430522 RepID=A0A1G9PTN0_9SPHI|nr:NAD(P)/FAD-dependent oxidoreductase [Pedobacter steynii]NQX38882.1 NAD(P)/FAD-dependent oxidoreductase [Pedobacter steynii]SDM02114.1 Thioredoxin reductase [Pedobacter steynii]